MKLRQRSSASNKKYTEIEDEQDQEFIDVDYNQQMEVMNGLREKKARSSKSTNYQVIESSHSFEEDPPQEKQPLSLINPQIEMVISRKKTYNIEVQDQNQEGEDYLYLAKFRNKSYYRCKWMTEQEMQQQNFDLNTTKRKGLAMRMSKTKKMRLGQQQHFNPYFLIPDRILTSTDVFASIHHKKANQIKGTWHQSLQMVCSKILNFQKNSFPYGTLLIDQISSFNKVEVVESPYSLQVILNRLYFCFYSNYWQIWCDIGKAINKFIQQSAQNEDYLVVGNTLKEAAQFLYLQWYILSFERYIHQKESSQNSINLVAEDHTAYNLKQSNKMQANFCKQNVFLQQKRAEKPKSHEQLACLNPGTLSFAWLHPSLTLPINYKHLNLQDMKQLDLNVEVDRFYFVKWKELSYSQSTWQRQSIFGHPQKIEQYKNINKMPNKEVREGLQINARLHSDLLKFYNKNRQLIEKGRMRKPQNIEIGEQKLYLLKKRNEKPAKQYKGKDVITFKNYKLLKDFQNESLNWFISNWYCNRNTILADEMGLGKTIQLIAFLYHLYMHEKVLGPFLVLAPLTTLPQWRREIQSWTNFNCLLYYDEGQNQGRRICQTYEFNYLHTKKNGDLVQSSIPKFQILLTNYENFLKDYQTLKNIAFQHIIVDQAHKMKNVKSQLSQVLRQHPCLRKTLLTGTPVQNNTKQLWSLLNYIEPRSFVDQERFIELYGNLNTQGQVANLKKMLKPFLLRRVKEDVQKLIPKLSQIIIDVEMTKLQKTIYKGILEKNKGQIIRGLSSANFNNIAIQFRKCCNHPFLISNQLEQQLLSDCLTDQQVNDKFQNTSGKMILLKKLLTKFKQQRKKTLIFSQFVIMLELLEEFLERVGFRCEMLHGGITASNRHRAITRFCEDGEVDVFLISTKAGGVGINLTAATEIVIFDSDWNPQNDIQATARAHRIGQKNEVTVYRLITANSYESQMFQIAARKLGMDKAIFNGDFFKNSKNTSNGPQFEQAMSKAQIQTLLKKGVLGFLQNAGNQQDFFKQDIDQILQKNARKMEYSLTGDKNYSYSKSKFVGDSSSAGLDINSQNFWEVALKDIESPIQKLAKKLQNTSGLQEIQKQEQLLLQALHIVSDFVKIRVSGSAFNAEDERMLFKFLGKISQSRIFNREYRQIADRLVQEIEKPSRRFKVTSQEIRAVRGGNIEPKGQNQSDQQQQQQEQSFHDLADQSQSKHKKKNGNSKRYEQKPNGHTRLQHGDDTSNLRADYQRVCALCLKPKCSIFCDGICKRSYHKLCWQRYANGQSNITPAIQLEEMGMDFNKWISQLHRLTCPTCKSAQNICICSICGEGGTLDEYQKNSDSMAKCKQKNCDRFYHLRCLSESEDFSWLVHEANKRNGGQEGVYINKLTCPVHLCYGCSQRVSKSTWQSLHSCVKCCKTYHPKCLTSTKGYIHLNNSYYICQSHLTKAALMGLQREYKLIDSDKKNIKQLKRLQKSEKSKRLQKMKQTKVVQKQIEGVQHTYQDFELAEIQQFDYSTYDQYWCRYCGSRFAEAFCLSPWGDKKLCQHHYKFWRKDKLDLSQYKKEPLQPISRKETEIRYLNKLVKERGISPTKLIDELISQRISES